MITPEARAIAEKIAASDRDLLAKLRRRGLVKRQDGPYELHHPEVAKPFIRDIEERARPKVNLAIRPNKKKRKR
jgi:hypothetical protein